MVGACLSQGIPPSMRPSWISHARAAVPLEKSFVFTLIARLLQLYLREGKSEVMRSISWQNASVTTYYCSGLDCFMYVVWTKHCD
jgi:hypothetical protein